MTEEDRDNAREVIGCELDMPSVYMGGASPPSLRKAERVIQALERHGFRIEVAVPAVEEQPPRPILGISYDRIYPYCVWCRGENYGPAVLTYSAGEIPCAAAVGCGRYLPEDYRRETK